MKLRAVDVAVHHGSHSVLAGVDLELQPGELVLLAGRNGAGKSTLLRVLIGAQNAQAGRAELDARDIHAWEPRARAREVAFVPQQSDAPFEFTGRELVAMGRHPHLAQFQSMGAKDNDAVDTALAEVDARDFADRRVTTLSGGELRRISVARALATEAPLMLLDEPTNNLDLEHALALVDLLRTLAQQGRGLLVASHDVNLLAPHSDRVVLLHEGRVHADGRPEEVLSADNMAAVFGVRAEEPRGYFPRSFRPL